MHVMTLTPQLIINMPFMYFRVPLTYSNAIYCTFHVLVP